jgi:hypothetical protein
VNKCKTLMVMSQARLSPAEEDSVRALGFDPVRVRARLLEINHERARVHASEVAAAKSRVKRLEDLEAESAHSFRDFMGVPVRDAVEAGARAAAKHGEALSALTLLEGWTPTIDPESFNALFEESVIKGREPVGSFGEWQRQNLEEYQQRRRGAR